MIKVLNYSIVTFLGNIVKKCSLPSYGREWSKLQICFIHKLSSISLKYVEFVSMNIRSVTRLRERGCKTSSKGVLSVSYCTGAMPAKQGASQGAGAAPKCPPLVTDLINGPFNANIVHI